MIWAAWSLISGNLEWVIGVIGALLGLFFARKSGRDAERRKNQKAKEKRTERIEDAIYDDDSAHWRDRLRDRNK
jgi:gas vesicle protein